MAEIVCEYPSQRHHGTVCGFPAEFIVDVVRSEGDCSSTFFTQPMCFGHMLALGEHVITSTPITEEWLEARRG